MVKFSETLIIHTISLLLYEILWPTIVGCGINTPLVSSNWEGMRQGYGI